MKVVIEVELGGDAVTVLAASGRGKYAQARSATSAGCSICMDADDYANRVCCDCGETVPEDDDNDDSSYDGRCEACFDAVDEEDAITDELGDCEFCESRGVPLVASLDADPDQHICAVCHTDTRIPSTKHGDR